MRNTTYISWNQHPSRQLLLATLGLEAVMYEVCQEPHFLDSSSLGYITVLFMHVLGQDFAIVMSNTIQMS